MIRKNQQNDRVDREVYCIFHPYNQNYLFCEECDSLICDKCKTNEHKNHRVESYNDIESFSSVIEKFGLFQSRIKEKIETNLIGFKDKIANIERQVDNFFQKQESKIDLLSKQVIDLIQLVSKQNKEMIQQYKLHFFDNFNLVVKEYQSLLKELEKVKNTIESCNDKTGGSKDGIGDRFEKIKKLAHSKTYLEQEYKKMHQYYNFDLNCLISDFSIRNYLSFLDNEKQLLTNLFYEEKNILMNTSIDDKIKKIILNDQTKKSSKNSLPKNQTKIYMPIDRTNFINCYDIESLKFNKFQIVCSDLPNFSFNQYCRYVNTGGRLYVSGGIESKNISNFLWIIEDSRNFIDPFKRIMEDKKKFEDQEETNLKSNTLKGTPIPSGKLDPNSSLNSPLKLGRNDQNSTINSPFKIGKFDPNSFMNSPTKSVRFDLNSSMNSPIKLVRFDNNSSLNKEADYIRRENEDYIRNLEDKYPGNVYNISSNQFLYLIRASNMINPHAGHAFASIYQNCLIAVSGVEGSVKCEYYKIETDEWQEIADLRNPRVDPSLLVHNNYTYVFFGITYNRFTKRCEFSSTIERIDLNKIENSLWELIEPEIDKSNYNALKRSLCGIVHSQSPNSIYIIGGQVEKDKYSDTILQYDLQLNFISIKKDKIPKNSGFLESNFLYFYKKAVNFDIYGDVIYYDVKYDTFNAQSLEFENEII